MDSTQTPPLEESAYRIELRVRITEAMSDQLGEAAKALGMPRAVLVRLVLRKYLRHDE